MTAFVDSSAWYAAADSGDRSHERIASLLTSESRLVTTDHVLVETWLLIASRGGKAAAEGFWAGLRGGVAAVEAVTAADLERAWGIGQWFDAQGFSIVGRTSFAVMERLGLRRAIALDNDFAVYRFGHARRQAFEVVR